MHIPDQFCTPVCDKTVSDALVDLAYDIHFSLEQQVIDLIDASLYRVFHGYYNILYFVILSSVKYILKGLEWQRCGVGEILQSRHFTISSSLTLKGNLRCHVVIVAHGISAAHKAQGIEHSILFFCKGKVHCRVEKADDSTPYDVTCMKYGAPVTTPSVPISAASNPC